MATMKDAVECIKKLVDIFDELGLGDPFAAGRAREAILADFLSHELGDELHGCDAYNKEGDLFEYKTKTDDFPIAGRYDVSSQPTWDDQVKYLQEEKIANNAKHYYATFTKKFDLTQVWEIDGDKVLELLLPKLNNKYHQDKTNLKVQNLHATLTAKDIRENGKRIL